MSEMLSSGGEVRGTSLERSPFVLTGVEAAGAPKRAIAVVEGGVLAAR